MYYHRYTVKGTGNFPLDMLRYDASFPSASQAVSVMMAHDERFVSLGHIGAKQWQPAYERWRSFGWQVERFEIPTRI